jgi:NAD(P)-dependent dehydrogenase (short-subunit alcohol dehydrogenase family)
MADRIAVITGAGSGIGRSSALALAATGWAVGLVGRRNDALEETAGLATGGRTLVLPTDVTEPDQVAAMFAKVKETFGRIDMLINNAAISDNKNMFDLTTAEWNRVLAITLTAPFILTKAVAQEMIKGGRGGRIVNVSSTSGYFGRDRATAYTAAKGGVVNLTKSQAIQLAPHKIRVNAVVPNKIGSPVGKDEFDPTRPVVNLVGRPGVPEDLANAVLFLVSEESAFIVGTALFVDGGCTTMMPGNA